MRIRFLLAALLPALAGAAAPVYPWLQGRTPPPSLEARFPPPAGYTRPPAHGYGAWLRQLPLKPGRPLVKLHDGVWKFNQFAHAAVVDIDAGKGDLQQCADAVMRLRGEYLYSVGDYQSLRFNVAGRPAAFEAWSQGERPTVSGEQVSWSRRAEPSASHATLQRYFRFIFAWAGSASLSQELKKVPRTEDIQAGDVIIQGGHPGHAVLVADVAANTVNGEKAFLLLQSYMPAQDIQLLRNYHWRRGGPWYKAPFTWPLKTPEWTFPEGSLKRFP